MEQHQVNHPTSIFTDILDLSKEYTDKLISEITQVSSLNNQENFHKALLSPDYKLWEHCPSIGLLLDTIYSKLPLMVDYKNPNIKFIIQDVWSAIYKKNHEILPHKHISFNYSFIFYLKTSNNSSPLIFDECDFKVTPKNNLLVVCPSYLSHYVPPNQDNNRIVIAGNCSIVHEK